MDPRAEMAFFTSSTFSAENMKTGETEEAWVGHCSFSRVLFLACTCMNHNQKIGDQRNRGMKNLSSSYHPVRPNNFEGGALSEESFSEGVKLPELECG